jgi:hypothetical protein
VARAQAAAQRLAQVGDVVLVDLEVGVARDAELRERLHLRPGNRSCQVGADHAGQQHEALLPGADTSSGSLITRGSTRGTLTMAISFSRPKASLPAQADDEVQRLVGHLRERVRRVQPHRHQQRPHLALEELATQRRCAACAARG